jgi:hypothetical protein
MQFQRQLGLAQADVDRTGCNSMVPCARTSEYVSKADIRGMELPA